MVGAGGLETAGHHQANDQEADRGHDYGNAVAHEELVGGREHREQHEDASHQQLQREQQVNLLDEGVSGAALQAQLGAFWVAVSVVEGLGVALAWVGLALVEHINT